MKLLIYSILILSFPVVLHAQQRDLNFYLDQAKQNSPLINKSNNENKIVDLNLEQMKAVLSKPEINIESSVLMAPIISHDNGSNQFQLTTSDAKDYSGYDLAATDGGQYQAMVTLKQPVFNKSKYQSYADLAEISHRKNENNIVLTNHELEHLVSYQYILCVKSAMQRENLKELVNELQNQLQTMQKLVNNAIYKQTDLMLLKIEYQNYESELKALQSEYITNIYDLNTICGINDTSLVSLKKINFLVKTTKPEDSQFLTAYKLDSLTASAEQAIFELKYKPQLDLFANAGLNAVYQPTFDRLGVSAGITLSWNIFDGYQRRIQRQKTRIYLQNIEFEKQHFMTQAEMKKHKMLSLIHNYAQRISISEDQLNQYNVLLDAYSKELSQGEISVMDYKNLVKDIASKKQENIQLKMERQTLISSYNYWNF